MKSFAVAAFAGLATAFEAEDHFQFQKYMSTHGRSYGTVEEYEFRMTNFLSNDEFIKEHNASQSSFKLDHNKMSDWATWEYKNILTHSATPEATKNYQTFFKTDAQEIDWRAKGAVTPVKDQAQCGSCWAFSSTGALEGAHFIAKGELKSFSEQQLVDCCKTAYGCNGGLQTLAFQYWQTNFADLESVYGYTGKNGSCAYDKDAKTDIEDKSFTNVTPKNVPQMKAALAQQPLAVAIQADQRVFQMYSKGIFDDAKCGTTLDHATLVVGWGKEQGQEYWIMKNSWGTTWGEQGYMRLAIKENDAGICGIQSDAVFPTGVN